ncbi:MAG: alanyl-tRNA editing protein AlaXM [Ignisphaera sp.]|nr:alanyl-tRNA editing protein AlaXM [Ignisphaera sp.]MCX8167635.1 alanyl-tRNA editing protein AlaXM [Ignisphaera sp.]MDW8085954.1 alanyl-tRNA editing protein AlaXM [Ignisphaera sp.]
MSISTELLYQFDSYLKEFEARVVEVIERSIVLNRTAFHPRTGGVANDLGVICIGDRRLDVVDVYIDREKKTVIHVVEGTLEGVEPGSTIRGAIDWNRRYRLMRLHTAAHILAAIMYRDYGALITGGSVEPDHAYDDYSLDKFDKKVFEDVVLKANEIVRRGLEVKIYWLKRDEALMIPGIIKLAERMPPEVESLRIVEIPNVDMQADGGPHVRNTREVGEIVMLKAENRGRNRKRLYYTVKP